MIVVFGGLWIWLRKRAQALFYIVASGVIYGFVATLAKVVIKRIQAGDFEWLTLLCLVALLGGGRGRRLLRADRVLVRPARPRDRRTHRHRPDGRRPHRPHRAAARRRRAAVARSTSPSAIAGAIAVWGVIQLARNHPQVLSDSQELPIERGSGSGKDAATPAPGRSDSPRRVAKVWPEPPLKDMDDRPGSAEPQGLSRRHVDDDPAVAHASLVTGGGRRSRHLDLRLPSRPRLFGGGTPHRVESRSDPAERASAAFQLTPQVVALEARSEDDCHERERDEAARR